MAQYVDVHGDQAKEPFAGSTSMTKVFNALMQGFVISNDHTESLTFTIHGETWTVKAGEVFEETFKEFKDVTITATGAFRAYGRG
jgi:hypothetical protein